MLIDVRERESKGEREKPQCGRGTSISCPPYAPQRGIDPQPRHMPWPRIEPATLQFVGQHSSQLSHTGQGCFWLILRFSLYHWFQAIWLWCELVSFSSYSLCWVLMRFLDLCLEFSSNWGHFWPLSFKILFISFAFFRNSSHTYIGSLLFTYWFISSLWVFLLLLFDAW